MTGSITIVGSALAGRRRWKARQVRTILEISVGRIHRQQRRLGGVIAELDHRLQDGTEWAGWSKWPRELTGGLAYLNGLADEAEREESMIRSLEALGPDERLRQDVEEMHQLIYMVVNACIDGTISSYQRGHGQPIPASANGHEVSPAFAGTSEAELVEARRRFTSLMRTCLHRLGKGDFWGSHRAEAFESTWTVRRWEVAEIDLNTFWGGEVRPLRWD